MRYWRKFNINGKVSIVMNWNVSGNAESMSVEYVCQCINIKELRVSEWKIFKSEWQQRWNISNIISNEMSVVRSDTNYEMTVDKMSVLMECQLR